MHVAKLYSEGEARKVKKMIYGPGFGGHDRLINYEAEARTKNGQRIPILLSAAILYEEGQEVATVGYFKDMREVKRLEQELLKEQRENLWLLASSFHRHQYQALWLRYVEEMSVKEIAVVLRKNSVTVRVMLHRARQKLAEKLSTQEISEKQTELSTQTSSEALLREK